MERAGRLFGQMNLPLETVEPRACAAWRVAAGSKVARHTRATALVRNTLIVEVADMIWQRQLSALRVHLLRNLARELGAGVVAEIDFRPTPARRPPQTAPSARPGASSIEGIQDPVMALLYKRSQGNR